ncbi:primosomal protein N' [Alkalicoccus urumqiensis]|uniref:Replication restart protein PriA n=1 Tax=Alkalicoccus urumqiensis TaxID=1548213 RepID=A0A2P6MG60_ALKUR|nr:primosomal protein N' [Alkalicoccus urumqiensis]PRO65279.1 primosomal protein N' [Alkalicoccus urumqiensis]
MIAEVIVDVPSQAVDRRFDYLVPEEFIETMAEGCRVHVPFAGRPVQGFVVHLKETTPLDLQKLKPVASQIDLSPALTPELLQLAEKLKETTLALHVAILKAMLPQAMRSSYKKRLLLLRPEEEKGTDLEALFSGEAAIDSLEDWRKQADEPQRALMMRAVRAGRVQVEPVVTTRDAAKKRVAYRRSATPEETALFQKEQEKRAPKQASAAALFQHEDALWTVDEAKQHGISKAVLETLTEQGILEKTEKTISRDPFEGREVAPDQPMELFAAQEEAFNRVDALIQHRKHKTLLLRGVTGSGKTEVYLQAIEKVIAAGREAIVLVPEISLTPQMVLRFRARFGSRVAVMHSALSKGEKYDEWVKIRNKEVDVVVGARSAVFAPFENLGLIIIDEEHEASYKQEESPRYHARTTAILRGEYYHCPVLLGSATPSLESYARAEKGVYEMLTMADRVNDLEMPEVKLIDMRKELHEGNRSMFSESLKEAMRLRMENKEQTVLMLNRRGYSSFIMCRDCGYVPQCIHCDISLTYHRSSQSLQCHYCGYQETLPQRCPECESSHIRFFGTGTQKVEEELRKELDGVRIIRMDVDTTRQKGSHEKLLDAFGRGEADILLGTQMIAKGLDFPNITLAGVLAADSMLHLPDFRAAERTFQLLTQVAGRAGRHKKPGEVLIQTYSPEHYSITEVQGHNYTAFYEKEMQMRRFGGYPPYYYLSMLQISHTDLSQAVRFTEKAAAFLRERLSEKTVVYGPTASPIPRIKDRYRYQCMIKYKAEPRLYHVLQELMKALQPETAKTDLQLTIDTNPYMMM